MVRGKTKRRRMYAVSAEGIGLIAGTLSYSRRDAISHFMGGYIDPGDWNRFKCDGYRTVEALVEIAGRYGIRRTDGR